MKSILITTIILTLLFVIFFLCYLFLPTLKPFSRDLLVLAICVLLIISLFMNYYTQQIDSFYFEVSPQRKKCLEEQVSLSSSTRSCGCCPKGTVGGYPPLYKQWLHSNPREDAWHRQDNWTTDLSKVTDLPPTAYVDPEIEMASSKEMDKSKPKY